MILIVAPLDDAHGRTVRHELAGLDVPVRVVDVSLFPQELKLTARYETGRRRYRLRSNGQELPLETCRVVWWRRPRPFVLHPEIAAGPYAGFAFNESVEAFAGLWQSLDVTWVNNPAFEQVAAHKLYQLRVAQDVGLEIPRTLVTNDPEEARQFVFANGPSAVAYKTFLPATNDWRETRVLRREELVELESVRYAPVIFQEYVAVAIDIRVTVVGEEIVATAIHTSESSYEPDYRMDFGKARVEPFELPGEIEQRLTDLMAALGIVYGAIDMRLTPDGRFVFLEVNPSGEWLFVEERSGQRITATFARMLATFAA